MNIDGSILAFDGKQFPEIGLWGKQELGADWYLGPNVLSRHAFIYMTRGKAKFFVEKQAYSVRDGDMLLIRKGQLLASEEIPHDPFECAYVHFDSLTHEQVISPDVAREEIERALERNATNSEQGIFITPESRLSRVYIPQLISMADHQAEMMRLIESSLGECRHPVMGSGLRASLCLAEMFMLVTRQAVHALARDNTNRETVPSLVQEAVYLIRSEYSRPITVRQLSSRLRITPQHLIRVFRKCLGASPLQYIHGIRMERAREMLRMSRLSIKEVCLASGFRNQHHFARLFARHHACSPSRFRETNCRI